MDDKVTYFKDYNDVITRLTKAFSDLRPDELRDLLFFLQQFKKDKPIPEDAELYSRVVPLEGLEVQSEEKISTILVGGVDKYIDLKYPKKSLPPVIVVRGGVRNIILYGEIFAIEAYLRKQPIRALVIDIQERDPFEVFKLDELTPRFLVPLIQDKLAK
jgi:hypothetical protein